MVKSSSGRGPVVRSVAPYRVLLILVAMLVIGITRSEYLVTYAAAHLDEPEPGAACWVWHERAYIRRAQWIHRDVRSETSSQRGAGRRVSWPEDEQDAPSNDLDRAEVSAKGAPGLRTLAACEADKFARFSEPQYRTGDRST
jgi:hypothetical protein